MDEANKWEQLRSRLPDKFSQTVFDGSIQILNCLDNPIRVNLFAAGWRELFSHLLHSLAPDEEVRNCEWFEQAKDTPTVTRKQRARYSAQGGLTDTFIDSIDLDAGPLHNLALRGMARLNKAVHVRPNTIYNNEAEIDMFTSEAVDAMLALLDAIKESKAAVSNALIDHLSAEINMEFIAETIQEIDILAGRGYSIDPWINDLSVEITEITSSEISIVATGITTAILYYGSKHDITEISHDFPFEITFSAPVSSPTTVSLLTRVVHNDDWFR